MIIWYICLKLESCANGVYYPSYTAWIQEVFIFLIIFCFYSFLAHATLSFSNVRYFIDTGMCFKSVFYQTRTTDDIISWCREINLMNVKTSFDFWKRCLASCVLCFMHQIMIYTFCLFLYLWYIYFIILCVSYYMCPVMGDDNVYCEMKSISLIT